MTFIKNSILFSPGIPEVPHIAPPAIDALRNAQEFRGPGLRGPQINQDAYFVRNVQNQLEQNGIVAVSDGRFRVMTHEHMEKIRHFIGKSDEPLFFLMRLNEKGEILGVKSFAKKSDWVDAMERLNLGGLPSVIRDLKSVDKITQLECLTRILGPVNTGL